MLYRKNPKNGKELSILGYGCLRFTKKGGVIDQKKAEEEMKESRLETVECFVTGDVREGRGGEKWLNVVGRKVMGENRGEDTN